MNIIEMLDTLIKSWDEECKCDLCWQFRPGGRADYFNNVKINPGEDCCVYVGVLSVRQVSGITASGVGGQFIDKRYCDWQIRMIAGIPSRLDLQFYNENTSHDSNGGKWEKYINPIFSCFGGCCIEIDLCDIHNCKGNGTTVEITRWESEMVMNQKDMNLDGVLINATFREWYSN